MPPLSPPLSPLPPQPPPPPLTTPQLLLLAAAVAPGAGAEAMLAAVEAEADAREVRAHPCPAKGASTQDPPEPPSHVVTERMP